MSSLMEGMSNVYSLTAQITALKDQSSKGNAATSTGLNYGDPDQFLMAIKKSFNDMLTDFLNSTDDDDDDDEETDIFDLITQGNTSLQSGTQSTINSYTGSIDTKYLSQYYQNQLNLNNLL